MAENKPPKCIWTARRDPEVKPVTLQTLDRFTIPAEKTFYVLSEHEHELYRFNEKYRKFGRVFLTLIIGLTFVLILMPIVLASAGLSEYILPGIGITTALIGVSIAIFPFPTPETVYWLGLRSAQKLVRTAGFLTIFLGLAFCLIDWM